jgi:prolyl-tRNA synthetase
MVLAMTHEEVVGILLADIVKSYRQLPLQVYHFQTKWRDEPRARAGLIRVREFVMKDAYSCDRDEAGLDASYEAQYGAYSRTFERLGLKTIAVGADVGIMGGTLAHEFMVLNPAGEDVLVLCEACGYAANRQIAKIEHPAPAAEEPGALEEIATPGTTTIATLARFLDIPETRTAKAAFFMAGDGRLVTAIVRGDLEVNETKLANAVGASTGLRPATVDEIKAAGMEPGYGSPIGAHDTTVVVDELVARSPNLVAGANREGFHYRNVNVGRDFTPNVTADITNAREGDPCPTCGQPLILRNGIEVGNIFKLGTKFTDAAGATYLGEDGREHAIVMGSYGIGVGRNVACVVEAHHDDKGIIWPEEVAPYAAHLARSVRTRSPGHGDRGAAPPGRRGGRLLAAHPLRRPGRVAGVKFTDAELLGMPWILTVSPRSLARAASRSRTGRPGSGRPAPSRRSRRSSAAPDRRPRPIRWAGDAGPTAAPGRRSLCPARGAPRRLVRGDRGRLAGAPQTAPSDVAGGGADADDRAKRINVAHDWLSDPELRSRYDRERLDRVGVRARAATGTDGRPHRERSGRRRPRARPTVDRPPTPLRRRPPTRRRRWPGTSTGSRG